MRKVFQSELEQLGDRLIEMTKLIATAIENANTAFETKNLELAQEVISDDVNIDNLQVVLDEQAIELLALQNPVASDLRMIVGALRMNNSLERMGDLAQHIAQLVRLRYPHQVSPKSLEETFKKIGGLDQKIAEHLIELLETHELTLTHEILKKNQEVENLHQSIFKAISDPSWQETPDTTVDVNLASRYYKRFSNHGVSVANKINYLVTGDWTSDNEWTSKMKNKGQ